MILEEGLDKHQMFKASRCKYSIIHINLDINNFITSKQEIKKA